MLTRIELTNFKIWKDLKLELSPLTLIFGTNSSGKSSILQSLLLLKQTASNFDRSQNIYFGGADRDYVNLGSFADLIFGHDSDQRMAVGLNWRSTRSAEWVSGEIIDNPLLSYSVRWRQLQDRVVIERLHYRLEEVSGTIPFFSMDRGSGELYKYEAPKGLKDTRGRNPYLPPPESCYGIPAEVANQYSDFFPLNFNLQFEALMSRIFYLGPLRRYPERVYAWTGTAPRDIGLRGENTVEALIASERRIPDRKKSRPLNLLDQVAYWLNKLDLVSEFSIAPIDTDQRYYKTRVRTEPNSTENTLLDVGFGVSQVLPVIALLFFVPKGSIVLIEQPELHLHPNAQANLADLFLAATTERNLQLIVESHSEHLVRRIQRRIAEREEYLNLLRMYFCEKGERGSRISQVEIDLFGQIRNWPKRFFGDIAGELLEMTRAGLDRKKNGHQRGG